MMFFKNLGAFTGLVAIISLLILTEPALGGVVSKEIKAEREVIPNHTLDCLNYFRGLHGAPKLVWNNTMALYAATVSGTCNFPTKTSPYQQHFYMGTNTTDEAIEKWHSMGDAYDYSIDPSTDYFGNLVSAFTQLIWKSATQVGCAAVDCTLDENHVLPGVFLTCEYDIGNEPNQYTTNVLEPVIHAFDGNDA